MVQSLRRAGAKWSCKGLGNVMVLLGTSRIFHHPLLSLGTNQFHSNPCGAGEGLQYCPAAVRAMSRPAPPQPLALGIPLG